MPCGERPQAYAAPRAAAVGTLTRRSVAGPERATLVDVSHNRRRPRSRHARRSDLKGAEPKRTALHTGRSIKVALIGVWPCRDGWSILLRGVAAAHQVRLSPGCASAAPSLVPRRQRGPLDPTSPISRGRRHHAPVPNLARTPSANFSTKAIAARCRLSVSTWPISPPIRSSPPQFVAIVARKHCGRLPLWTATAASASTAARHFVAPAPNRGGGVIIVPHRDDHVIEFGGYRPSARQGVAISLHSRAWEFENGPPVFAAISLSPAIVPSSSRRLLSSSTFEISVTIDLKQPTHRAARTRLAHG